MVTLQDIVNLTMELEQAKTPNEMITYGGAPHASTLFVSNRYLKHADEIPWCHLTKSQQETLN